MTDEKHAEPARKPLFEGVADRLREWRELSQADEAARRERARKADEEFDRRRFEAAQREAARGPQSGDVVEAWRDSRRAYVAANRVPDLEELLDDLKPATAAAKAAASALKSAAAALEQHRALIERLEAGGREAEAALEAKEQELGACARASAEAAQALAAGRADLAAVERAADRRIAAEEAVRKSRMLLAAQREAVETARRELPRLERAELESRRVAAAAEVRATRARAVAAAGPLLDAARELAPVIDAYRQAVKEAIKAWPGDGLHVETRIAPERLDAVSLILVAVGRALVGRK